MPACFLKALGRITIIKEDIFVSANMRIPRAMRAGEQRPGFGTSLYAFQIRASVACRKTRLCAGITLEARPVFVYNISRKGGTNVPPPLTCGP